MKNKRGNPRVFTIEEGKALNEVLNEAVFTPEAYQTESVLAHLSFIPPHLVQSADQGSFLFHCQAAEAIQSTCASRVMRVRAVVDGRPIVEFLRDGTFPELAPPEERHALKVKGTIVEIHVVKVEE
jgi:hypothetical protein